jgi:hypothetical protein
MIYLKQGILTFGPMRQGLRLAPGLLFGLGLAPLRTVATLVFFPEQEAARKQENAEKRREYKA